MPTTSVWLSATLQEALDARAREGEGKSGLIARDLERYYTLLQDELRTVQLSEAEAGLIMHAMMGTLMEPMSYRMLWAEVADDARLNGAHEGFGLTQEQADDLAGRLREMTPGQIMAVVDAAERAWRMEGDWREAVRRVGLVR